jgi:hypothetical protein
MADCCPHDLIGRGTTIGAAKAPFSFLLTLSAHHVTIKGASVNMKMGAT